MPKVLPLFLLVLLTLPPFDIEAKATNLQEEKPVKELASPVDKKSSIYSSFVLENGMQVIVIPNHKVPAITHMVWYKVGSIDEPEGKSGIAHYLEHLMFKGTETLKAGKFSSIVAENGGKENAMTSYDFTAYFQSIAKEHLPLVMQLESDRMVNLKIDPKEAETELQVVLEERRSSLENNPSTILRDKVRQELYKNHPYNIAVIGKAKDLKGLTKKNAMDFYRKYYAPNNAILVVSGDVNVDEVKDLATKYYGNIKPKALPARNFSKYLDVNSGIITENAGQRMVTYGHSSVKEPEWIRYYRVPSARSNRNTALSLVLLSHILGNSDTSRFYKNIVLNQGIASNIYSSYDEISLLDSNFIIAAIPKSESEFARLEIAVEKEINRIAEDGVTAQELERAKNITKADSVYARDGIKGMAFTLGYAVSSGLTPEYVTKWGENIEAITSEDVQDAAKLLDEARSVTGVLTRE